MQVRDKFSKEFNVITKIGDGSFGIAYKVKSLKEGGILRAVKKQKEEYKGIADRNLRRQEVANAFQLCSL